LVKFNFPEISIGRDFQLNFRDGQIPAELMNSDRFYGSICFTTFNFDYGSAVAIMPLFTRFGSGVHNLKFSDGTISANLLYLIMSSVQESVEIVEVRDLELENQSNLRVFFGEFQRLKKLIVHAKHDQLYSSIFKNYPNLEILKLSYNFDIIQGKTKLKRLSIGEFFSDTQGKKLLFEKLNKKIFFGTYFLLRFEPTKSHFFAQLHCTGPKKFRQSNKLSI
jgi:hypothetical protein